MLKNEREQEIIEIMKKNNGFITVKELCEKLYTSESSIRRDLTTLENQGIMQYEISNFSKQGFESRHNLKYWHCEEYLGLGPSAHSFLGGKRFYFDRDFNEFMNGNSPIQDGLGGDFTEYTMLNLRLVEGLNENKVLDKFGHNIPKDIYEKSEIFIKNEYMTKTENGIALTRKGFLMSNTILAEIL